MKEKHLTLKKNSQGAQSRNSLPVGRPWLRFRDTPSHTLLVTTTSH